MELDMLGDQRTAMFVIISDTDDTFNFIVQTMLCISNHVRESETTLTGI